ncbi:MAG: zinc ribbon domain-containing protein [Candidatus Omnitrophica bacterium]|nr:zinc ribbon domain-containing protein [Candidatus Omnitrophota bacterium]
MPTYEYECKKCKKTFEKFQAITALPLKECPVCGGKVRRLIGRGGGIIFKGSGFYETDYKRKSSSDRRKDSGPSGKSPSCSCCPSKDSCAENK